MLALFISLLPYQQALACRSTQPQQNKKRENPKSDFLSWCHQESNGAAVEPIPKWRRHKVSSNRSDPIGSTSILVSIAVVIARQAKQGSAVGFWDWADGGGLHTNICYNHKMDDESRLHCKPYRQKQKKEKTRNRIFSRGATRNRTGDTRIFSPLLYQLSYGTIIFAVQR